MARRKRYTDRTVLEATRARIAHLYDTFDTVCVGFSGGKDSLVALHLVRDEAEKRGKLPVKVIFRDEEIIPSQVVDFVDEYRRKDWVDMRWFCYPLTSDKFVMGNHGDYIQWDPNREWVRPMPEWAILPPDNRVVYDQQAMDHICCAGYKGKVALVLGIRASESLVRFRSVVNKLNENWITRPLGYKGHRIKSCKPVYDWQEKDIFKFMHDEGIRWCPWYDIQNVSGSPFRVATPLHAEGAKKMDLIQRMDPDFYDRILKIFPEAAIQARYWKQYDRTGLLNQYRDGWDGCKRYIEEHIKDPRQRAMAEERYRENLMLGRKRPHLYNPELLLKALVSGTVKRTILPTAKSK